MSAKNPLIKGTHENALNGVVMPNISQIGRFWSFDESGTRDCHQRQGYPRGCLEIRQEEHEISRCEPGAAGESLASW